MGHIKEPSGVDFVISSRPLTKSEELAISDYIKNYKAKKNAARQIIKKANSRTKKRVKSLV
jgi:hypothetical protein